MTKVKKAVILAAGSSKRFGRNKLEVEIEGKTLPQRAVEFCISNGIDEAFVTISKRDFNIRDHDKLTHPIMEQLERYKFLIDIKYGFQADDEYGPGAAVKVWKGSISEPFVVLFGDNYYKGGLKEFDEEHDCEVSYIDRPRNARNLQLAAIQDGIVIEKPHPFVEGKFFCGYVIFSPRVFDVIDKTVRSDRNEYEITDLINFLPRRFFVVNDLSWADITFAGDEERVAELVREDRD